MLDLSQPRSSSPPVPGDLLERAARTPWLGWLLFSLSALGFAAFVRVTLYGWAERAGPGAKGLLVPAALLVVMMLWLLAVTKLLGGCPPLFRWT